jgi:(p)ppGpp synthase/HD superfamily hydrolase
MSMYVPAAPPPSLTTLLAAMSPSDAERLLDAYRVAAAAHHGQLRDEGTPFIEHPVRVAQILWSELGVRDVDLLIAALNHDVLEDCELDVAFMTSKFGEHVAELVLQVTKPPAPVEERAARDTAYLAALRDAPRDARMLKLADRIDNLRGVPHANDPAKAARYLRVSRAEFLPLALLTDPTAERLIAEACDAVETYLRDGGWPRE